MKKHLSLLAAALLCATSTAAAADKLGVGDPAPKLTVAKWVKGEPVTAFEKNHIYVVEFWATWCGPCRVSIPHISDLQSKNKDVTFIGVSVWERENGLVEPFVEKMGDKMAYRVAMDSVPEGAKANEGAMAKDWMTAAQQRGIPAAFVVNGQGVIAWIGHPMQLDGPLAKIVAGKWDIQAEIKLQGATNKITQALKAKDAKGAIAAIDDVVAMDPALESQYGTQKFKLLLETKAYADAYAYATKLVDGVYKDSADALNLVAWSIVDPEAKGMETRDLKIALKAATRANELSEGKRPEILDTLAKVQFDSGEVAKAVETQQKAVDLAKGTNMEEDLTSRLEEYKKAAGKPKG